MMGALQTKNSGRDMRCICFVILYFFSYLIEFYAL